MSVAEGAPKTVLDWARRYVAAGLSVIPVRRGGTKAPAYAGWREFSARLPTDDELVKWFTNDRYGIGVTGGPASGNLAVIDFETKDGLDGYADWLSRGSARCLAMVAGCPLVRTPTGGHHLYIRMSEPAPGGVMARTASGLVLIEVRGNGNFVVAPGSPLDCHKTGKPYTFESAGWLAW